MTTFDSEAIITSTGATFASCVPKSLRRICHELNEFTIPVCKSDQERLYQRISRHHAWLFKNLGKYRHIEEVSQVTKTTLNLMQLLSDHMCKNAPTTIPTTPRVIIPKKTPKAVMAAIPVASLPPVPTFTTVSTFSASSYTNDMYAPSIEVYDPPATPKFFNTDHIPTSEELADALEIGSTMPKQTKSLNDLLANSDEHAILDASNLMDLQDEDDDESTGPPPSPRHTISYYSGQSRSCETVANQDDDDEF